MNTEWVPTSERLPEPKKRVEFRVRYRIYYVGKEKLDPPRTIEEEYTGWHDPEAEAPIPGIDPRDTTEAGGWVDEIDGEVWRERTVIAWREL